MPIITTIKNNQIALVEITPPFERLLFQFVPETIPWDRSANWVKVPIVGRNNSKKQLTGGEDTISLNLDFNGMFETDRQYCQKQFMFLNSLTILDPDKVPSRVQLIWGTSGLFRGRIWIVKRVSGAYSAFHSGFDMAPMQLTVSIDLELDPDENSRLNSVRMNGVFEFADANDEVSNPNVQTV